MNKLSFYRLAYFKIAKEKERFIFAHSFYFTLEINQTKLNCLEKRKNIMLKVDINGLDLKGR